jgi:ligand-binding sensor domain-containing protein
MNFNKLIYILLFSSGFFAGCNGQVNNHPQKNVTDSIPIIDGQAKMIKTQGKYNYRTATGSHLYTNICIWAILEDKLGNIWVATMGEGVYRYDGKSFTNFTVADGLVANLVYSMIEDKDGNIWFGTSDGVSKYNGETFTNFPFSVIRGNSKHQISLKTTDPLKELFQQFTEVWSMVEDTKGKIWLGTTDGVFCYDGVNFTSLADLDNSKNSSLKHISVSSIAEDKQGNIWFTSWADGLCMFDGKSITKVTEEGFNTIFIDRNGHFWLGRRGDRSDAGLYRYDGKTFTKLLADKGYMANITEDKSGKLWFSNALWVNHVLDGGIVYFNPSTSEIISRFTTKSGLSDDNVHAITIDKAGNVWFGMCRMTLAKYDGKTFTNFYSE